MHEKKIVFLLISILFIFIVYGTSIFAASTYIDDDGNYFPQTYDQVPIWQISIEYLGLIPDAGSEVVVINSSTGNVNIADPNIAGGGIAGYFAQNLSISPGTYTQVHVRWGIDNIYNAAIYDPVEGKYRATPDGTLYDTKAEALNNASSITIQDDASATEEYLTLASPVTISAGETFTLTVLWKNYGLEAGIPSEGEPEGDFGVAIVWNPTDSEFQLGMLKETYSLE